MKLGIIPINIGVQSADQVIQLAQHAESLGYESVWTFEHVIVPLEYQSSYPYNESGKMGAPPETNLVDPLITLAAVAAATKTIRLGTGVNILSQVNPLYMAKQAASLDFMSGGRFMLGVGIGWLKEEFEALGVLFIEVGNSQQAMMQKYDFLMMTWIDFEFGGSGVCCIHQKDLIQQQSNFKQVKKQKNRLSGDV